MLKPGRSTINLPKAIYGMSRAMAHRGPDGEGFTFFLGNGATPAYTAHTPAVNRESVRFPFNPRKPMEQVATDGNIGEATTFAFAHRRLSIIDLSEAGHQPMCNADSSIWITFNGEIYNYIELRAELEAKGFVFSTHTDTEVIIHAYRHWGLDCLQRFNGMWAFSLYDAAKQQLFCARDRVGVKPFYYINSPDMFAFASEHKAFLKPGLLRFEVDEALRFDFLAGGRLEHTDRSLFKNIFELKPAHYLLYDLVSHRQTITYYGSIRPRVIKDRGEAELVEKTRELLLNAVRLRLRSDVEVGSCLSGGIDSSAIAGMAHALQPTGHLKLFTSVFEGEAFDEAGYASQVAASVDGQWHTVSPSADDFFNDIAQLNYYQDLPVWSTSTYSQYRVMQLASQHGIKVVLDGQGADEIFSGYTHHYLSYWKELAAGFKWPTLAREMRLSRQTLANPFGTLLKQYLKDASGATPDYKDYLAYPAHRLPPEKIYTGLNRQLEHDYAGGRLKSYLKCEDRCSMAFGIESRVPFADDPDLVNHLFSLASGYKIKNGTLKYLLREAVKNFIPSPIYQRKDKVGFETPQVKWLRHGQSRIMDTIAAELDTVKTDALKKDLPLLITNKPHFVLRLYSFAVWKNTFSHLPVEA